MAEISAKEYLRRLNLLTDKVLYAMEAEELTKDESTLLELKKQDNLEGDVFGDGKLYNYRSKSYANLKRKQNPIAGGHLDLIKTGRFINSFFLINPKAGSYLFGARDSKKKDLVGRYGIGIMGLNPKVFLKYQKDIILPRYVNRIKRYANIG